jgi:8-amino-3,8-dideoxy-alpha-D-manno-octulosonate transaminase
MKTKSEEMLASEGGPKAVPQLGPFPSKLGREELWELIDMWEFSPSNKERIKEILDHDSNIEGPHLFRYYNPKPSRVAAAEEAMRELIGTKYCLAVNSCTSALIASYRALGIGAGDEVIVPAYTFFASAAGVVACNGIPVIAEVDDSLTLDPEAAERSMTRRTKAIVVVHMRGAAGQMDALLDLAKRKGLPLVEDVAQAGGGSFQGKRLGSIGAAGCFSFDHYKIMSSGEGGFVTTDDEWLYTRAQSWHDTAACWRPDRFARERREGELFAGENYRMSELQGAVAVAQIRKTDYMLARYRRGRDLILAGIDEHPGLSFRRLTDSAGDTAICLIMFLPNADVTRRAIQELHAEGVPAGGVYDSKVRDWHIYTYWDHVIEKKSVAADRLPWSAVPAEELPHYSRAMCPRTLDLLGRSVHIEINPHYTEEDCQAIAGGINKVLHRLLA